MTDRIERSFRLVAQSYRLLMQDKVLMVLPLLSGIIVASVVASFFVLFRSDFENVHTYQTRTIVLGFLLYVVTYATGIFFQGAVVAGATQRMRGENPTIESALAAVTSRIGSIIGWAIIAATVGMLLRAIQDRVGFLGKIFVGLAGMAWSLATFFVVPVLVLEDLGPGAVYGRSIEVFETTWGEAFVGSAGVGVVATMAWFALGFGVFFLYTSHQHVLALVAGVTGGVLLSVFFSALQGVYVASLYRFATHGEASGFDRDLLRDSFVRKD